MYTYYDGHLGMMCVFFLASGACSEAGLTGATSPNAERVLFCFAPWSCLPIYIYIYIHTYNREREGGRERETHTHTQSQRERDRERWERHEERTIAGEKTCTRKRAEWRAGRGQK